MNVDDLYSVLLPGGRGNADPLAWFGRLTEVANLLAETNRRIRDERSETVREAHRSIDEGGLGLSYRQLAEKTGATYGRVHQLAMQTPEQHRENGRKARARRRDRRQAEAGAGER